MQSNGTFQVSSAGSTFNNLVILGHVYNGSVPANTRINLPLVGYIVLNEQTSNIQTSMANLTVNMLHVHITVVNILGLQVGTEIVVSSATSGMLNVFAPAILNGQSFGTEVLGSLLSSAPTAPVITPCLGTQGSFLTNTLAGVNLPSILNSGTVTNTAETNLTNSMSSGRSTSTVEGLNLLNGLVTANVMTAQVVTLVNNVQIDLQWLRLLHRNIGGGTPGNRRQRAVQHQRFFSRSGYSVPETHFQHQSGNAQP